MGGKKRAIETVKSSNISSITNQNYDVIVVNTSFNEEEINDASVIQKDKETFKRIDETNNLIRKAGSMLKNGGLLFVYGHPKYLPIIGLHLNFLEVDYNKFYFKYWISIELEAKKRDNPLANSHVGILMYLKSKRGKNNAPFHLNTKTVRMPYGTCKACNKNLKDWGGKKHLMNPLGSAFSDVWLDKIDKENFSKIPDETLNRIYDLTGRQDFKFLFVEQDVKYPLSKSHTKTPKEFNVDVKEEDFNRVILGDSLKVMDNYCQKYPNGVFDLVFADPPYNLSKNYSNYDDEKRSYEYVKWCNLWLQGMLSILKPGGALMVLNIPKWAIFHAEFLLNKAEFRHWIVWDALSSPTGKIMPAHYALLYFTKPGGKIKNNFDKISNIDARHYCNRSMCMSIRKKNKDNDTEILSDIWRNIFRIKHKKDRDKHPCQLPIKLMERIIELTTDQGDLIYDPFGGAGTTAIAAKLKKRNYVISDLDENYVKIATDNLKKIQKDLNGNYYFVRKNRGSTPSYFNRNGTTKREVEKSYMDICQKFNEVIDLGKLEQLSPSLHNKITSDYGDFTRLRKIARRMMEAKEIAQTVTQRAF